jgi:hypothetical protein
VLHNQVLHNQVLHNQFRLSAVAARKDTTRPESLNVRILAGCQARFEERSGYKTGNRSKSILNMGANGILQGHSFAFSRVMLRFSRGMRPHPLSRFTLHARCLFENRTRCLTLRLYLRDSCAEIDRCVFLNLVIFISTIWAI